MRPTSLRIFGLIICLAMIIPLALSYQMVSEQKQALDDYNEKYASEMAVMEDLSQRPGGFAWDYLQDDVYPNLLVEVDSPDMDLLANGALDSMRLVDLLLLLEQRFGLNAPLETLDLENFRSVRKIAELISNPVTVPDGQPV